MNLDKGVFPTATDMFLEINRPEYVSVPEGFISSLAWRLHEWDATPMEKGKPIALMFRNDDAPAKNDFELRRTAPRGKALVEFGDSLKNAGIGPDKLPSDLLATAVTHSVTGIRAERSKLQAASPLSPGFALLQNMRGIHKKSNPPDLAEILESLYRLGLPANSRVEGSVAHNWLKAVRRRLAEDSLLSAMDDAVMATLLGEGIRLRKNEQGATEGQGLFPGTPFAWFVRSWDRLTSDEWVSALPARVWVDWATTVLRLALGMGFLWEASWYEALGRKILNKQAFDWEDALNSVPVALPWKSSRGSQTVRDVASFLPWRVQRGAGIRGAINQWLKENNKPGMTFDDAIRKMIDDASFCAQLTDVLGKQKKESQTQNRWDTLKYTLQTREVTGPHADYYGLLRKNGRYLTVEPGTEWIAVVASLTCGIPNGEANVGKLMADLKDLGLNPELADVVSLLERAGLSRGSADADQGVMIKSAF